MWGGGEVGGGGVGGEEVGGGEWGGSGGGGMGGGMRGDGGGGAEILLAESCHEQMSFESGFKQRKGRRISEIRWQRVPDQKVQES